MKLFRTRSNNSTPQSQAKSGNNRLTRILGTNRSRVSIDDAQSPSQRSNDVYSLVNLPPDPNPAIQNVHHQQRQLSISSAGSPPSLPPLPMGSIEDSFIALPTGSPSSQANLNSSVIDERDMNRKLLDVESSFVPEDSSTSKEKSFFVSEPSRWPHTRGVSPDRTEQRQTYLQYGPDQVHHRTESLNIVAPESPPQPPRRSSQRTRQRRSSEAGLSSAEAESTVPDQSFYTAVTEASSRAISAPRTGQRYPEKPLPQRPATDLDLMTIGGSPASIRNVQDIPSSPIEAATHRREGRVGYTSPMEPRKVQEDEEDNTPKQPRTINTEDPLRHSVSSLASMNGSLGRNQRGQGTEKANRSGPRPSRFSSRHNSQYSTISSAPSTDTFDDPSDTADYALQTGGAQSREDSFASLSAPDLPRAPSLGSEASSIHQRSPQKLIRAPLKVSDPLHTDLVSNGDFRGDRPVTPPFSGRALAEVTDTVLAQHVRDVHVPDTIAKEYRASHVLAGAQDTRPSIATPPAGGGKSNLTLKEQNTKIDKLSKENFDLKLKIHFLHQALQERSDEGVRELISKNAQLQAELVKAKKDAQALRKRLRELEKLQRDQQQQQDLADTVSLAQSTRDGSTEDNSAPSVQLTQIHEDIVYYRDRASLLETENEKLAQIWQSVLDEEVVRRKQVEKDAESMRLELSRVKERHAPEVEGLQQEIARLKDQRSPLRRLKLRRSRPNLKREDTSDSKLSRTKTSQSEAEPDEASMSGTTVVEQLRQENAELRRNLGAQTSMLTSRNRERERLQGEIEDLKLVGRREDARSIAGDSVLDRSVSRNQQRSVSRASIGGFSQMSDADRDRYESLQARLRDENALLRMRNQDLQREVNALDDLRVEADADIEQLSEAVKEMEEQLQAKEHEIEELLSDLSDRAKEGEAFRQELLDISDGFNRISDDREATQTTIESLQQDLVNANRELESMEQKLRDMNDAKERLEIQQESSSSEIAFLREEQEGDKIKIGELQTMLEKVRSSQREEASILKEVEELGAQASRATEEARRLRKALSLKEREAATSNGELLELERALRDILGNRNGDRSTLLKGLSQIQQDLRNTINALESMKQSLNEKEDEITERDGLLDASNNEIRRLTELINGERQAYRLEKSGGKTVFGDHSALLAEIEIMRLQERKRLAEVEMSFNEHLKDRNTLLLALWTRLATLCGTSWAERHKISAADGTVPTLDTIAQDVGTFGRTISMALKHVEANIGHFRTRLHSTEEQIWQDFQTLDLALQDRAKRLQELEELVMRQQSQRNGTSTSTSNPSATEFSRLKDENKLLRRELKLLKPMVSNPSNSSLPSPVSATSYDMPRRSSVSDTTKRNSNPAANAGSPRSKRFPIANSNPSSPKAPATSTLNFAKAINPHELPMDTTAATAGSETQDTSGPSTATSRRPTSALGSTAALGMGRSAYARAPSFHRQLSGSYDAPPPSSLSTATTTTARPPTAVSYHAAPQHQHQPLDSAVALSRVTSTHASTNGGGAEADASWLLRLQEMQRRLEREREGRLLDRDGARTRLEEGKREVHALKRELERVRARNGGAAAAGPGARRGVGVDGDSDVD